MIEFLSTTDPKKVLDWVTVLFSSALALFLVISVGSRVIKEVIEFWGLDK